MKKITTDNPAEKLTKARMQLLMTFPFFGSLVMRMVFHESKTAGVGTTCVDHKGNMYYHPDWVNGFVSIAETQFEVAHEMMHLIQRCIERFPNGGDHRIWNIAADIKVDTILVDAGLKQSKVSQKNITPALMQQHAGKTTEQIYYYLLKNPDAAQQYGSCPHGDPKDGDHDGPVIQPGSQVGERGCTSGAMHMNQGNSEDIEKWKQHVIAAALQAKSRGSSPGFIEDFLAEITRPSVTWKEILRKQATSLFRGRYTQSRQSRRSRSIGMRLPSRSRSPMGAAIAIDTSGSINDDLLSQFVSECSGILRETGCQFLLIYFHDTVCYHFEKYNLNTINKIKVTRGGTSHIDVFNKLSESTERIGMVIAFTDLDTMFPNEAPAYPVIWAVPPESMDHTVPFGKKIKVEINK
jgi:predicted metal-dependent peptidase